MKHHMKAEITNFMGCSKAEITANPIALLIGVNHQGKSSTLRPLAAALTGESIPLGLKKADAGLFVKLGSVSATVKLMDELGTTEVTWPKAERSTTGDLPPMASHVACGLTSILDMDTKKRVEYIRNLLKCTPTKEDLTLALEGTSEKIVSELWATIQRDGWEATHTRTVDKGRDFKSQWAYVTGEQYGSKKAPIWSPVGWDDSMTGSSMDEEEAQLQRAKAELDDAIARQAIGDDVKEKLFKSAESKSELEEKRKVISAESDRLAVLLEQEMKDYNALPQLLLSDANCPHCNMPVSVNGKTLTKVPAYTEDELTNISAKLIKAKKLADTRATAMEANQASLRAVDAEIAIAKKATEQLGMLPKDAVSAEIVNSKREAVRNAEAKIKAFISYTEAKRLHRNVVNNQLIADALDENGVRRVAMQRGLGQLNDKLKTVYTSCGWSPVTIDNDLTVYFNERPYLLLSASEQFRVKVTLQLAIADIDNSNAVVIDGADILDNKSRGGLLRALSKQSYVSFVGMMVNSPDLVPKLSSMGCGHVYWLENGISKEVE